VIYHLCSHFGDIEVEDAGEGKARVRFFRLTPMEREALDAYLGSLELESLSLRRSGEGDITVPQGVAEAGSALGAHLHGKKALLSAVRFRSGEVKVTRYPFLEWFRGLMCRRGDPVETTTPPVADEAVAAVQTPVPVRGCPAPTPTDLREARAAAVVRKFLTGQQAADFDRRRAFLATGCDTGTLYRLTSRWTEDVTRYGVLYNMNTGERLCASSTDLPPSEEILSMLFAVEHFERRFLRSGHGTPFQ